MNTDMLDRVATWLESGAPARDGIDRFNMVHFIAGEECGTACCIAGAVVQFNQTDKGEPTYKPDFGSVLPISVDIRACKILKMDWHLANRLFTGENGEDGSGGVALKDITPDWAARCIRKLIKTGIVDWTGTRS